MSRPTEPISRGDDAEQPPKWQVLCADSIGSGDINDNSKHPAQYKLSRNKKCPPSRRRVQGSKKNRRPKQVDAEATQAKDPVFGEAFTVDARRSVQVLLPWLQMAGVVKGPVAAHGSMARAIATAFCMEFDGWFELERDAVRIMYGAERATVDVVHQRLRAAGGAVAVLAQAALEAIKAGPAGPAARRKGSITKAERCCAALCYIGRGGMKLRAAHLLPPSEQSPSRCSTAPPNALAEPPRPQPLRPSAVAGAATAATAAAAAAAASPASPTSTAAPLPAAAASPASPTSTAAPLPDEVMPGGSRDCGGNLLFPLLTLVADGQMPLFVMTSGAVALVSGSDLVHGTTEHHAHEVRAQGCEAHVSFAVQTPAPLLGSSRGADCVRALHDELLRLSGDDARETGGRFSPANARWLAVQNTPEGPTPSGRLLYDSSTMTAMQHSRIVLFDAETHQPLVLYDSSGGLTGACAKEAGARFAFLDDFKFTLHREQGSLGVDAIGEQRMLMLGVRNQGYNLTNRPDVSRKELKVANPLGDLCGYVAHWDIPELYEHADSVRGVWNSISARLNVLLPRTTRRLSQALEAANVRGRMYCEDAKGLVSNDGVCCNVGVSAAYQSPAHSDANDVGLTAAFSIKCYCGCAQRRFPAPGRSGGRARAVRSAEQA